VANVRFEAAETERLMYKPDIFERHAAAMVAHLEVMQ
jgi:hypothetical protein